METNKLIKLAVDAYKNVPSAFSEGNPSNVIRNALIELNGGDTKISYKKIRDGKCQGLFALVEELIVATVLEGLPESNPIFQWAETKNGALGDKPEFVIQKDSILAVATITSGTQGVRRQRIFGEETKTLTPVVHAIKIYEEMDRLLSGRADWSTFVNSVAKSFIYETNNEIVAAFASVVNNADAIHETGAFSETKMLDLIEAVELQNPGKVARIYGTKTALRNITVSAGMVGETIKNDYYNMGYLGKFNGTEVFEIKNALKADGVTKVLADDELYVVAADDKFVKYYIEGDATIIKGEPTSHADLTQDYLVASKWAVAVVLSEKLGTYKF